MLSKGEEAWEAAREIASEVVDSFSQLHPNIRLNWQEWSDLREMIEREVVGHTTSLKISASDLLPG